MTREELTQKMKDIDEALDYEFSEMVKVKDSIRKLIKERIDLVTQYGELMEAGE